ncbi:tetratricopeptide repeat-containing diguanylate cyclase [Rheinheimera maricola]|uniref:Diguanylate cyclase n=1 Tax=Rheinheimera maricola TaxID=2793282 RepID=A0ABS7X9T5_9GAMM|nr:diguanylate cyclase [Rheinheimera maricola]MBZ9612292.1 diguanylate cyclase [Rheinheimera maricola]
MRFIYQIVLLGICCACASVLAEQTDISQLQQRVKEARQQGNMDEAEQLASHYLALAVKQNNLVEQGNAYFNQGRNAMERNNYIDAKPLLEQAIALFQRTEQTKLQADALRQLGMTYRYQSNYPKALELLYQVMQMYQALQDTSAIASTYNSIGTVLEKMGQYEAALQAHQQSLALHYQLGEQSNIASAIYNLGDLNRTLGDSPKALSYFLQSLELDKATGDLRNIAYSHNKLGYMYCESGDFVAAAEHLNQALALFVQVDAPRDADWARVNLAKLAMAQNNHDEAQQILDNVIARAQQKNYHSLLVDAYKMVSELAIRKGDDEAALSYIAAGLAQAQQNNELADEAQLQKMRVDVLIRQDAVRDALTALLQQKKLEEDIFSSKKAATIASIQAQTEYTRQQLQIERLQQQQALQQAGLEQQRLTRNLWLVGLTAVFVLMLSLYRRYIQQQQNRRLEQQVNARTQELKQKHAELESAYQQLETISLTDKLTGLHNRHFLESHIENDLDHCQRLYQDWRAGKTAKPENADLVVFLIDLDNFKALNDTYGHNIGDEVLKRLKHRMQQVFRQTDYLVRWGGEEFVAVARFINREDAKTLAQRFIETIQQSPFIIEGLAPLQVSCSLGYACYPLDMNQQNSRWPTLLRLADLSLYAAKYSGRNGWVGIEDCKTQLTSANISAEQLQHWLEQNKAIVHHSFPGSLYWQQP